jgi:arsenite transporter
VDGCASRPTNNTAAMAIATATVLFGLSSGAALAAVVGVLIEVPVMLMLAKICLRTHAWFPSLSAAAVSRCQTSGKLAG